MRHAFRNLLMISMLASVCLLTTACSEKDLDGLLGESGTTASGAPEGSATFITSTPSAQEDANAPSSTLSGVSVEYKMQKYKVIEGVNVRSDCNGESEMKGSFYGGEVVQGTGVCENGWIQFLYDGEYCYATGSCFEEVSDDTDITDTQTAENVEEETPEDGDDSETVQTPSESDLEALDNLTGEELVKHDVTDWAKYTSSKWEASGNTSCFVQIHSVAGNTVIFRFYVVNGSLADADKEGTLKAEVKNCTGKIEDGVMNFFFTDDLGNSGVGRMTIIDDTHLKMATVVNQPAESAEITPEIITELTKQ